MSDKQLDSLIVASREKRAWQLAALLFAGISIVFAYFLINKHTDIPIAIVPHTVESSSGRITVKSSGVQDYDYISNLAVADIKLLTDWQPATIDTQYNRFLNRLTPEYFANQNVELIKQAKKYKGTTATQVFYPHKSYLEGDNVVGVKGNLVRWEGEKEVFRNPIEFKIYYEYVGGKLYVANVETTK